MDNKIKKEDIDILNKKFNSSSNGYSPIEVDQFLDAVIEDINLKKTKINELLNTNYTLVQTNKDLQKQIDDISFQFKLFKSKFKNIKETDIIDNESSIELLKRVNAYECKLVEVGIDPKSLLK